MAILWNNDPRAAERYSMAVGETLQPVESASLALRVLESDQSQQLVIIGPDIDITRLHILQPGGLPTDELSGQRVALTSATVGYLPLVELFFRKDLK